MGPVPWMFLLGVSWVTCSHPLDAQVCQFLQQHPSRNLTEQQREQETQALYDGFARDLTATQWAKFNAIVQDVAHQIDTGNISFTPEQEEIVQKVQVYANSPEAAAWASSCRIHESAMHRVMESVVHVPPTTHRRLIIGGAIVAGAYQIFGTVLFMLMPLMYFYDWLDKFTNKASAQARGGRAGFIPKWITMLLAAPLVTSAYRYATEKSIGNIRHHLAMFFAALYFFRYLGGNEAIQKVLRSVWNAPALQFWRSTVGTVVASNPWYQRHIAPIGTRLKGVYVETRDYLNKRAEEPLEVDDKGLSYEQRYKAKVYLEDLRPDVLATMDAAQYQHMIELREQQYREKELRKQHALSEKVSLDGTPTQEPTGPAVLEEDALMALDNLPAEFKKLADLQLRQHRERAGKAATDFVARQKQFADMPPLERPIDIFADDSEVVQDDAQVELVAALFQSTPSPTTVDLVSESPTTLG